MQQLTVSLKQCRKLVWCGLAFCLIACRTKPTIVTPIITEITTTPALVTRLVLPPATPTNTPIPSPIPTQKRLIVCLPAEPEQLNLAYRNMDNGSGMPASQPILDALYEADYTRHNFANQAVGLTQLPLVQNGDVHFETVTLQEGERMVDSNGRITILTDAPISITQTSIQFTLQPRIWSDGTPVTAQDSVYTFQLHANQNSIDDEFLLTRTQSYSATGELTLQWVGIPGYIPRDYLAHFMPPLPSHPKRPKF